MKILRMKSILLLCWAVLLQAARAAEGPVLWEIHQAFPSWIEGESWLAYAKLTNAGAEVIPLSGASTLHDVQQVRLVPKMAEGKRSHGDHTHSHYLPRLEAPWMSHLDWRDTPLSMLEEFPSRALKPGESEVLGDLNLRSLASEYGMPDPHMKSFQLALRLGPDRYAVSAPQALIVDSGPPLKHYPIVAEIEREGGNRRAIRKVTIDGKDWIFFAMVRVAQVPEQAVPRFRMEDGKLVFVIEFEGVDEEPVRIDVRQGFPLSGSVRTVPHLHLWRSLTNRSMFESPGTPGGFYKETGLTLDKARKLKWDGSDDELKASSAPPPREQPAVRGAPTIRNATRASESAPILAAIALAGLIAWWKARRPQVISRSEGRRLLLFSGAGVLVAVTWYSIPSRVDLAADPVQPKRPGAVGSTIPSGHPPPSASAKPAISDPLLAGVYSDGLDEVKARFLSGAYDDDYGFYLRAFATRLAKEDPRNGLPWLLSCESTGDLQLALSAFASELQRVNSAQMDWALEQAMPPARRQAFISGTAAAMSANLDGAIAFIRKAAGSPTELDWFARSLMMTLSQDRSADGCLKLMKLAGLFPNAVPSEQHGAALYYLWIEAPDKAEEIMAASNDFQLKPDVLGSFTELYARKDLEAASQWVNALPDGLAKDCAIGSISKAASHVSPLGGLRWATSIRDNDIRPQIMSNLVDLSAYHDPEATKQLIEKAGFTPEESAKWIKRIDAQSARLK